jgi:hypothetical protein
MGHYSVSICKIQVESLQSSVFSKESAVFCVLSSESKVESEKFKENSSRK